MNNRKTNNIKKLQQEVIIPQVVEQKTEDIFRAIQNGEIAREMLPECAAENKCKRNGKHAWAAAAAAIAMSTVTAGAATYLNWDRSLEGGFQMTGTQKQSLVDSAAWSVINQSVTCEGVTITAAQCLVDNYSAYITFKIEGFDLPEGGWPGMAKYPKIIVGGQDKFVSFGDFYSGLVVNEHGKYTYDDGTKWTEEDGYSFMMEDGSLEYRLQISTEEKGGLLGKPIYIKIRDICYLIDHQMIEDKLGAWEFNWVLKGTADSRDVTLHETLGDTREIVTGVEISPLSIKVTWQKKHNDMFNKTECIGIRTKDGKEYMDITGGGGFGYPGEKPDEYVLVYLTTRVMDLDQIDALFFIEEEEEWEFRKGDPKNVTIYTVPLDTSEKED